ncbi:phospho-N-acetylmuramoyl-pentapeptide-transferase [Synechococcus elongatus]|uniref:phospho-N-acetylmuramoyl-pentapeptide- transferase n=1 Tax=Synechococcus elongatus TaxID=32046 RepID=UPI0030D560B8
MSWGQVLRQVKPTGRQLFLGLTTLLAIAAWGRDRQLAVALLSPQSQLLALGLGFALSAIAGYWAVPLLRRIKAGQFIREDGPQSHLQKAGTPTMGGIFAIPAGLLPALILAGRSPSVWAVTLVTVAYAAIGWLDDWQILRHRNNKGISPKLKLTLQFGVALLFCLWLISQQGWQGAVTTIALPFGWGLALSVLFWPLAVFTLVSESNATNLTDGLDGLAGGTGAAVLTGLGLWLAPQDPALATVCCSLAGGFLGFLLHNHNPARVFMGDTGSLALGGAIAAIAIVGNCLWVLLVMGGLFVLESLSVILQVSYYKATKGPDGKGKRLFRMAPWHHHLELGGWSETQVVASFYGLTLLLIALCWLLS